MPTQLALDCGRLIDGVADEPIEDATVLIEDGRIEAVGPREGVSVPSDADRLDHSTETVIPGLIDAHVHLGGWRSLEWFDWVVEDPALGAARATNDLTSLLRAGFTSVREVGSRTAPGLREAVAEGSIPGPRIYTSGLGISQTGGFSDPEYLPREWAAQRGNGISTLADGPDECRKTVRERLRDGVDLVKIWTSGSVISEAFPADRPEFTDEEVRAITDEAHRAGVPVASHASGAAGVRRALDNGVDTIEHGRGMDRDCMRSMREQDAVLVPTLAYPYRFANLGADHGVSGELIRRNERAFEDGVETVREAYEAGVPIALGTDFCGQDLIPHGENALEAELYAEAVGMDEMDVIKSATSVAARTVPDDDLGGVRPGTYADLVVLDGDPLADLANLRDVEAVYAGGERVALDGV